MGRDGNPLYRRQSLVPDGCKCVFGQECPRVVCLGCVNVEVLVCSEVFPDTRSAGPSPASHARSPLKRYFFHRGTKTASSCTCSNSAQNSLLGDPTHSEFSLSDPTLHSHRQLSSQNSTETGSSWRHPSTSQSGWDGTEGTGAQGQSQSHFRGPPANATVGWYPGARCCSGGHSVSSPSITYSRTCPVWHCPSRGGHHTRFHSSTTPPFHLLHQPHPCVLSRTSTVAIRVHKETPSS